MLVCTVHVIDEVARWAVASVTREPELKEYNICHFKMMGQPVQLPGSSLFSQMARIYIPTKQ